MSILNLDDYLNKKIRVKFAGGREVIGTLLGWDKLFNLVIDDTIECITDDEDHSILTENVRTLGLVVARGQTILLVSPNDGTVPIENPWAEPKAVI